MITSEVGGVLSCRKTVAEPPASFRGASRLYEEVTVPNSAGARGVILPPKTIPAKSLSKLTKTKSATEVAFS